MDDLALAFPPLAVVGVCACCAAPVFDNEPHEFAHPDTNELMWPNEPYATLYCGVCSSVRCATVLAAGPEGLRFSFGRALG